MNHFDSSPIAVAARRGSNSQDAPGVSLRSLDDFTSEYLASVIGSTISVWRGQGRRQFRRELW